MTNGRGAGMASFMTKKKKYKFQVDVSLEELLEVPFVSAVLFAKLRLLDGGNFQDHSQREEVRDHTVKWNAEYKFPCKMLANASTGVLERCVLRISVRKELKGGKSFTKLGFVDLNLAEFAGAGSTSKKALLEGYDARRRQDNSMLKFSIKMNMLSGDVLFKVPSPTHAPKQAVAVVPPRTDENVAFEPTRMLEDFSSGSLGGSIGSGSSGFGSLTKKRPALSDLVIGQTLTEGNVPTTLSDGEHLTLGGNLLTALGTSIDEDGVPVNQEPGHSRNSSNTSQMSKASGYSSIHSHSRQSSSGDSGHIRDALLMNAVTTALATTTATPAKAKLKRAPVISIPSSFPEDNRTDSPRTPRSSYKFPHLNHLNNNNNNSNNNNSLTKTPNEAYGTPRGSPMPCDNTIFYTPNEICAESPDYWSRKSASPINKSAKFDKLVRNSLDASKREAAAVDMRQPQGILRSKSDYEIPRDRARFSANGGACCCDGYRCSANANGGVVVAGTANGGVRNGKGVLPGCFPNVSTFPFKSDAFRAFVTPMARRRFEPAPIKGCLEHQNGHYPCCTINPDAGLNWKVHKLSSSRISHRKILLDNAHSTKLTPMAVSPEKNEVILEMPSAVITRRPSFTQLVQKNPSSSSLATSETGSLDRAKAAFERRKKTQSQEPEVTTSGRVEGTRVNPDHLIEELLKNTKLDQTDETAESSGLQLYIAKDGTTALGSHEVKSQMFPPGVFTQVLMDDNR